MAHTNRVGLVDNNLNIITTSNPLPVQLLDTFGHNTPAAVDPLTASLATIDVAHGELHAGRLFCVDNYIDIANASASTFLFVGPASDKHAHLMFETYFELEGEFAIYLNPTTSSLGTSVATFNRNLGVSTASLSKVYANPGLTADGTLIIDKRVGSGKASGGEARSSQELIVPSGSTLLVRVTNHASGAANLFDYEAVWYEVDNFP